MKRLIVGLGNPGRSYAHTRHNLGMLVVSAFAEKQGWTFKPNRRLKGDVAHGKRGEQTLYLLLPMTYMNLSGQAVRAAVDYYAIATEQLIVVVDDAEIDLGTYRLRASGRSGGHNGLKSIESQLSVHYPRLRMGVGPRGPGELEDFVLGTFTAKEKQQLPRVLEQGVALLETWLDQGLDKSREKAGELSKMRQE